MPRATAPRAVLVERPVSGHEGPTEGCDRDGQRVATVSPQLDARQDVALGLVLGQQFVSQSFHVPNRCHRSGLDLGTERFAVQQLDRHYCCLHFSIPLTNRHVLMPPLSLGKCTSSTDPVGSSLCRT